MIRSTFLSLCFYFLASFGNALSIKANMGVGSFLSLSVAASEGLDVSVGMVTMVLNLIFLLLCLLLDDKRGIKHYLAIALALICQGKVIDFFYYQVLSPIVLSNYVEQCLCLLLGIMVTGIGLGRVLAYHILEFPIEHFCQLVADKWKRFRFVQLRYSIDVFCVLGSLVISLFGHQALVVREGTLITMLLVSGVISWSQSKKWLHR